MPLDYILIELGDEYAVDWLEFVLTCVEHNWNPKGTLLKIENAVKFVYDEERASKIMSTLSTKCEPYMEDL